MLGALSFAAARLTAPATPLPAEVRFEVPTPNAHPIQFAISPDGRRLAFVVEGQLWIRDMAAIDARAVPGIEGVRNPTWSPSGRWIAFNPRWRADGRELFFLRQPSDQSLLWTALAVDVRGAGAGLEFGPPRRLFTAPGIYGGVAAYSGNYIAWATSDDGQRFFLQQPLGDADATRLAPLVVIMNHPAVRTQE